MQFRALFYLYNVPFIKIYVIILQSLQCTRPKPTKYDQIVGKSSDGNKICQLDYKPRFTVIEKFLMHSH